MNQKKRICKIDPSNAKSSKIYWHAHAMCSKKDFHYFMKIFKMATAIIVALECRQVTILEGSIFIEEWTQKIITNFTIILIISFLTCSLQTLVPATYKGRLLIKIRNMMIIMVMMIVISSHQIKIVIYIRLSTF